ncbi:MAG: zf-HC2 domain-containing protein, partial [Propionibacteriaceae bacterium]|nr:zf-HC2 domain-containing protein [Propionibacteriaceae bacterium]
MRPCPSRRRDLAELIDGALDLRERERLCEHLATCPGCREEAASLRAVRDRLRRIEPDSPASAALTDRLLSIAGEQADQPLYARPFDPQRPGTLPSPRRRAYRAVAGAMTLTCLLLAGLVGVGWTAAPPTRTQAVDPGPDARLEFTAALGKDPLGNPAVAAARGRYQPERKTRTLIGPGAPSGPLTVDGAHELLLRAAAAQSNTAHAGTQIVQIRHLAGFWLLDAHVVSRPGRGAVVAFPEKAGPRRAVILPVQERVGVETIAATHDLVAGAGPLVAGRPTHVVEAHREGRVAARWWLDAEAGLVLWEQTFDARGEVTMAAGYRSITVGRVAAPRSLPPRLAPRATTANLSLNSTERLRGQGWWCHRQLAGLRLVQVRHDERDPMVHTVYGNGVVTLSVFQQRGALAGAPAGFVWDPERKAYRSLGMTTMYSWQSGDRVFT